MVAPPLEDREAKKRFDSPKRRWGGLDASHGQQDHPPKMWEVEGCLRLRVPRLQPPGAPHHLLLLLQARLRLCLFSARPLKRREKTPLPPPLPVVLYTSRSTTNRPVRGGTDGGSSARRSSRTKGGTMQTRKKPRSLRECGCSCGGRQSREKRRKPCF